MESVDAWEAKLSRLLWDRGSPSKNADPEPLRPRVGTRMKVGVLVNLATLVTESRRPKYERRDASTLASLKRKSADSWMTIAIRGPLKMTRPLAAYSVWKDSPVRSHSV